MKTFFLWASILTIAAFGWYFKDGIRKVSDILISPYKKLIVMPSSFPKPSVPPGWKIINVSSYGLKLYMPPGWKINKDEAVIKASSGNISIAISTNSGLLVPSVFNQDLFKKIYNLKEGGEFTEKYFYDEIKFKNIGSGKILTGQPYTVFEWDYNNTQSSERTLEVRAFIIKDTTLIIFILNNITGEGIEVLKEIVSFSILI